jgi:hypothetical protein
MERAGEGASPDPMEGGGQAVSTGRTELHLPSTDDLRQAIETLETILAQVKLENSKAGGRGGWRVTQ